MEPWCAVKQSICKALENGLEEEGFAELIRVALIMIRAHGTLKKFTGRPKTHFLWSRKGKLLPTSALGASLFAWEKMRSREPWNPRELNRWFGWSTRSGSAQNIINNLVSDGILFEKRVDRRKTFWLAPDILKLYREYQERELETLGEKQQILKNDIASVSEMLGLYEPINVEPLPIKQWLPEKPKLWYYDKFKQIIDDTPPGSMMRILFQNGRFFKDGNAGEVCMQHVWEIQEQKHFQISIACQDPESLPLVFKKFNPKIYKRDIQKNFNSWRFLVIQFPNMIDGMFIWRDTANQRFWINPLREAPRAIVQQVLAEFN